MGFGFGFFCPLFNNLLVSYLQLLELNILRMCGGSGWGAAPHWGGSSRVAWHLFLRDTRRGPRRPVQGRAELPMETETGRTPLDPQTPVPTKPSPNADGPPWGWPSAPPRPTQEALGRLQKTRLFVPGRASRPAQPRTAPHRPAAPARVPAPAPARARWGGGENTAQTAWGDHPLRSVLTGGAAAAGPSCRSRGAEGSAGLNRPRAPAAASGRPVAARGTAGRGVPPAGHHLQQREPEQQPGCTAQPPGTAGLPPNRAQLPWAGRSQPGLPNLLLLKAHFSCKN